MSVMPGLVHDDQLVRPDRRRVRDVTGCYLGADEQSFQRVGRVPQLLLESAFLLDLGFDPFGIVEGQEHSDGHAFASDAVFELAHRPGAGRQADDAVGTVFGLPCLRDRFHGGGLACAGRSDDAADQAGVLQRVCGRPLLVGCERIAALCFHPLVPLVEPSVAFPRLVSDSGGFVETGDHVLFGFEHVGRRVLVEVGVLEHALPLACGDAQIVQRAVREFVPVRCEFDALAERPVGDLVRDDDALCGVDAHLTQETFGFGAHVGAFPYGVRVDCFPDDGACLTVQIFVAASGEPGEVGELAKQESCDVVLAFCVHMHEAGLV